MLSKAKQLLAMLLGTQGITWLMPALANASEWQLNMTEGVTDVSAEVYGLHMLILWVCTAIGVVVFGIMFYTMYFHRKSRGVTAANFHHSTKAEIIWTAIPVIILIAMAYPATSTLKKIYDTSDSDVDILITGYQWKWKYEYLGQDVSFFSNLTTSRDEIEDKVEQGENYLLEVDNVLYIPTGKKVRFLVTAADVIHSWWVPDLAVKRDAIPGFVHEAWTLIPEGKEAIYRGQCTELCGKDHGFMPVVVKAVPQAEFDAWLGEQREQAAAIKALTEKTFTFDELMTTGESVYASRCAACHGGSGEGGVGPAIKDSPVAKGDMNTHLDVVINGVAGTAMQAFGEQLSEVDAAAVITYQRNAFGNEIGDSLQPIDVLTFKQGQ